MIAQAQFRLSAPDLETILGMVRAGTLASAGALLGQNASTVFRSLQRIEKGLGMPLFVRTRTGYMPTELALELAVRAERMEAELEVARTMTQADPGQVSGTVKITTTDTILHELLAPALRALASVHPLLGYELNAGNELASLTLRDADIALRATRRPPDHLVGKHVGPIRVALFASALDHACAFDDVALASRDWIAPDEALPDHPGVLWRKKRFPKVMPRYRVNSILTVAELIGKGLGIGLLPLFLAGHRSDLRQVGEEVEECRTELWLLAHPESRHLRRVSAVYQHLAGNLLLP